MLCLESYKRVTGEKNGAFACEQNYTLKLTVITAEDNENMM